MTSLWWDTLPDDLRHDPPTRTPLDGDVAYDVAIIGAGYTGLWTAYYLLRTRPDLAIAVVEAEVAGFGASGRNGGWCSALFPASFDGLAKMSSPADAHRMLDAMIATVDEVGAVAAEEGLDIHWRKGGTLTLARSAVQGQRLREEVEHERGWGRHDTELLTREQAVDRFNATDVIGGIFTPHCAAIHPARLARGLARVVEARGARIYEHTRASAIEPGRVMTERGAVRAPVVVRATEAFTRTLAGHRRTLAPIYSLMIATEPLPADFWERTGLGDRETFSDGRNLIIYGQRTVDDRFAFGGRGAPYHFGSSIDPVNELNAQVHRDIWEALVDLVPDVAASTVTHRWGGPIGVARDWMASCGFDPLTGLAWAGGYVGDGVSTTNLAGRTLADLITGASTDLVTLPWVGHRSPRWEPEPLRWIGANAGLRIMGSADEVEARTGRPSLRARAFGRLVGK